MNWTMRAVPTGSEVEAVLNGADTTTPMGIRDRAVLEVLYSTGMRRMEVIGLRWDDIDAERGTVFIREGKGKADRMTQLVRSYVSAADRGKSGSCHLFQHSCATLMLENGAGIRSIQQLLGHAKLDSTQIYTQVSIRQLKQVHTLTHPANMGPEGEMLDRPDDSLYDGDDE